MNIDEHEQRWKLKWKQFKVARPSADLRKPFLVVGFLILHERGVVDLHDPVSKFLPEFEAAVVGPKRRQGRLDRVIPGGSLVGVEDGHFTQSLPILLSSLRAILAPMLWTL